MAYQIKDNNIFLKHGSIKTVDKPYRISRVRDMAEQEKPREKMMAEGVSVLSSAELLSVVLGVGTKKEEVFTMSNRVLKEYGEKGIAYQKDPKTLEKDLKIPSAKACQIVACFELGRRFFQKKPGGSVSLRSAKQAFEYLKDMGKLNKEQFRGLYLNSHYQIIHDEVISIGTIDSSLVAPREVFRPALEYSAAAIIVAHNHPSGVLKATKADLAVTAQLIEAGKIIGIDLLDHLIIGEDKFISLV